MNDLGWVLVGAAVRATLLVTLGLAVVVGLRRRGPSAAALAGSSTLLIMVAVTFLALSPWPRWWSPGTTMPVDSSQKNEPTEAGIAGPTRPPAKPVVTPQGESGSWLAWSAFVQEFGREVAKSPDASRGTIWSWPAWMACLFLGGLSVAVFRLALGVWAVCSLRSRSTLIDDRELMETVSMLRGELDIEFLVEIRQSSELATPATIGWRRPAVLLPDGWTDWDHAERRAVLAHELAHIYRGDYATGLAAQISLSLHFYHPLVHLLARRLRLEQELAADTLGASLAGGRRPYLTALANLALRQDPRPAAWPARPFLPTRGTFLRRIEMLRDPKALQHPPLRRRARAITVGTLVVAGLLIAGLRGPNRSIQAQDQPNGKTATTSALSLAPLDPITASSDVHLVIDIRLAEVLKHPDFKKLLAQLHGDQSKPMVSLLSGEIEQVVILGFERQPGAVPSNSSHPPQLAVLLRSTKPIDWKPFMSPKAEEVEADGFSYFRAGKGPGSTCFRLINERTFLMGIEADATTPPIGNDRPKGRHSWDEAWKNQGAGPIRLAFDTSWLARIVQTQRGLGVPGAASMTSLLAPLLDKTQAYALTIAVPQGLTLDALAVSATEDDSRRVADTLRACVALSRNAIPDLRRVAEAGHPALVRSISDMLDALDEMLGTAKFEQDKNVTKVHAEADAATVATAAKMLLPALTASREASRRAVCVNNLKHIMLAMHNYHSANDQFPPAVLTAPDGKTKYSWRVALLPYLEQAELYNEYKFDEPWDGPNNIKLVAKMPAVFACPDDDDAIANHTSSYFAPTGPESLFPDRKEGARLAEITDGTSNTIMIFEAKRPIPWIKPEDIPLVEGLPLRGIGQLHPGGYDVGFADGSVHFIKDTVNVHVLRALFTRAGGEVISSDSY